MSKHPTYFVSVINKKLSYRMSLKSILITFYVGGLA